MDTLVVNQNCWIMETKQKVPVSHGGPSRVDFSFFPRNSKLQEKENDYKFPCAQSFPTLLLTPMLTMRVHTHKKNHSAQAGIAYEHSKDTVAEGFWENPDINLIALP